MGVEHKQLDSFVLVHNNEIISPELTTTREYGVWFSSVFDRYTSGLKLFMKTKTNGGNSVLVSHPGTRIGDFYNSRNFSNYELKCWYLKPELVKQLISYNLADARDCKPKDKENVLRVYTIKQIEVYVQMNIDKMFRIGDMVLPPKKVQVNDLADVIKPNYKPNKRKLF